MFLGLVVTGSCQSAQLGYGTRLQSTVEEVCFWRLPVNLLTMVLWTVFWGHQASKSFNYSLILALGQKKGRGLVIPCFFLSSVRKRCFPDSNSCRLWISYELLNACFCSLPSCAVAHRARIQGWDNDSPPNTSSRWVCDAVVKQEKHLLINYA